VEERNLVIRIQDKGISFAFLDNDTDAYKVSQQMRSFQIIDHDITNKTCSEILEWTGKWRSRGLINGLILLPVIIKTHKGGFPVLARSSSQLAASACMSTFIQSKYLRVNFN
jgi:hypothetical protein